MVKKLLYLFIIFNICSGCTILNSLPNPQRDKWYMENATDLSEGLDFLRKVKIGFTKEQVLEAWGEPWKKRNNVWIYDFPQYFSNKMTLKFRNNVVIDKGSTMW